MSKTNFPPLSDENGSISRVVFFGLLSSSLKISPSPKTWEPLLDISDSDYPFGRIAFLTEWSVTVTHLCSQGLELATQILHESTKDSIFPEERALLGLLGEKAIRHMEVSLYCLTMEDYDSLMLLLRTSLETLALMKYFSKNTRDMETWVQLTIMDPDDLSKQNHDEINRIQATARNGLLKLFKTRWFKHLFNMSVHPSLWGLMVHSHFVTEEESKGLVEDVHMSKLEEIIQKATEPMQFKARRFKARREYADPAETEGRSIAEDMELSVLLLSLIVISAGEVMQIFRNSVSDFLLSKYRSWHKEALPLTKINR